MVNALSMATCSALCGGRAYNSAPSPPRLVPVKRGPCATATCDIQVSGDNSLSFLLRRLRVANAGTHHNLSSTTPTPPPTPTILHNIPDYRAPLQSPPWASQAPPNTTARCHCVSVRANSTQVSQSSSDGSPSATQRSHSSSPRTESPSSIASTST